MNALAATPFPITYTHPIVHYEFTVSVDGKKPTYSPKADEPGKERHIERNHIGLFSIFLDQEAAKVYKKIAVEWHPSSEGEFIVIPTRQDSLLLVDNNYRDESLDVKKRIRFAIVVTDMDDKTHKVDPVVINE